MQPRISFITLGVSNLARAVEFYRDGLKFPYSTSSNENVAFFQLENIVLGLYPTDKLAEDATVPNDGTGFRGVTVSHNVATKEEVAQVLTEAEAVGATIIKPAQDVFWGGHSGYFADPDGHLWEVAYNPFSPLDENGVFRVEVD